MNGNHTYNSYTQRNQVATTTYLDNRTVTYTYNGRGLIASRTNQSGQTVTNSYDGAGRLIRQDYATGGWRETSYDPMGRPLRVTEKINGHETEIRMLYNAFGNIISTTQKLNNNSWQTLYAYNYQQGTYTTTYPSGAKRVVAMDTLKRLNSVRAGDGTLIADYSYDDVNNYLTVAYANGTTTRTDYDALRRTTRISSALADYRYGYDVASNRTYQQAWHDVGQPADVYAYDSLYQLSDVWYGADATAVGSITSYDRQQGFNMDRNGNRLSVSEDGVAETYAPHNGTQLSNNMNRYEQVGGSTLSYDEQGNLLTDGSNNYTYDLLNRQIAMTNTTSTADYIYDGFNRRLAKVVDGVTTIYIYDIKQRVLEERAGDNTLLARYTYGLGVDEPLTMERGGITYYYHRDALGSITEISNASGTPVEQYAYDVYGLPHIYDSGGITQTTSTISNTYLFTGRRYDVESGNYYYRARIYSPQLGRFLQMDPAGYADDGSNLYEYVGSQPTMHVDPLGLFKLKVGLEGEWVVFSMMLPPPVPPGIFFVVRIIAGTKVFTCCNKKTGKIEWWGELKVGVQASLVTGTVLRQMRRAPEKGGYRRDRVSEKTGETWRSYKEKDLKPIPRPSFKPKVTVGAEVDPNAKAPDCPHEG